LEAIDDRFAFRATMTPNFSMRSLLAIDHAHLKGRKLEKNQLQDDSVTLEELTLLSDVVRGASLKTRITLPDAVLLLKNLIITEYVKAAKAESKKEVYVSPRSIAKAQDVLVASAILNGRNTVTVDDLAALRYTIPKLGDQEFAYEKIFDRVCKELVSLCAPAVMEKVDILATFDTLITNLIEQGDGVMKVISPSLWERIKILLNITSIGEITVDRLKKGIEPLTFDVEGIDAYKKSLLQVLDEQRELIDQQAP
jgi:hypothetical protein